MSNFLYYNQTNINGEPNDKVIYNDNTNICLNECMGYENCQGISISNPQCEKNIAFSECVGLFTDIDILNTNPENLYKPKCRFLSNIDNSNQVNFSEENKSYIKDKYINMLDSKFNSIRPVNYVQYNKMLCMDVGVSENNGTNNRIELVECNYLPAQIVQEEQEGQVYENFKSFRRQIENKLDDVNFCSNPIYKTIVFIILVVILIYFIWFVSRKQYSDGIDITEMVSTPFAK